MIDPRHLLKNSVQAVRRMQMRHRLRLIGLTNVEAIHTFTSEAELWALHGLASKLPARSCVVEIGSYLGASTCYLAAGLSGRSGRLWCVDTWQNETMPDGVRDTFAEFKKNLGRAFCFVTVVRKNSTDLQSNDLPDEINLAFIDGDHCVEATRSDFKMVESKMAAGGIVAFHDIKFFSGVSRVVGEVLAVGGWRLGGVLDNLGWIVKDEKFI